MSTRPGRCRLVLTLPITLLIAACGTPSSPSASTAPASAPPVTAQASASPVVSEVPGSSSPGTSPAAGQTDTDWGPIWDTVPAGFPRFPGSTDADDASPEPASARFAVAGGDPAAIATWMQDALETATFSTTGLNGPAEDGSFVLDSVGDGECRIRTTIAPLGDTTFITILYGADCPAT